MTQKEFDAIFTELIGLVNEKRHRGHLKQIRHTVNRLHYAWGELLQEKPSRFQRLVAWVKKPYYVKASEEALKEIKEQAEKAKVAVSIEEEFRL